MAHPAAPLSHLQYTYSLLPALGTQRCSQRNGPCLASKRTTSPQTTLQLRSHASPSSLRVQKHKRNGLRLVASSVETQPSAEAGGSSARRPKVVDLMKLFQWEVR
eukprot:1193630-Prorocentrum_minimum.AAC.4